MNVEWLDLSPINTRMRYRSRCYKTDNSWGFRRIGSEIWPQRCEMTDLRLSGRLCLLNNTQKQDMILFTGKRKNSVHERDPGSSTCIFSHSQTVAGYAVSLLQRCSHIKILVSAWRQCRSCCLFAEQLPLTETLILSFLHPPPYLWKKQLYVTEEIKHPSILFITAETASSDRNIHPSALLKTAERKGKHALRKQEFIFCIVTVLIQVNLHKHVFALHLITTTCDLQSRRQTQV